MRYACGHPTYAHHTAVAHHGHTVPITVTPSKESGALVAHLYDVGPLGLDPLRIEHNPSGAQLTFSSPANDPSYLSLPFREQ